jgi:hypothetical protein
MSKTGSSTDSRKHYYAKKNFEGTAETREALDKISAPRNTLPLMSNEDFYSFCQVRRILLEQPYLTTNAYSKAMRAFMDGWLEEQK